MSETANKLREQTNPPANAESLTRAVFRICLSGIFIVAGLNHLFATEKLVQKLEAAPLSWLATGVGPPEFLILGGGVALLIGGVAMLLGFHTRKAALGLMLLLVPITITVQVGRLSTIGPLFKNIAIFGALLYFAFHGSNTLSVSN